MRNSPLDRRHGRAFAWLLAGLLVGGAIGAGTMYILKRGKAGIPGGPRLGKVDELAMVPPDSTGFIHVRARDIWKSDNLEQFRKAIEKAGPDALKLLDEGFVPSPSSLDRMTVVFLKGKEGKSGPPANQFPRERNPILPPAFDLPFDVPAEVGGAVVILAFTSPFESTKIRDTYMPDGVSKIDNGNGKPYWLDRAPEHARDLGLYFPSDTVMVIGPAASVELFVAKQTKDGKHQNGPLTAALRSAAEGGQHMIAGINVKSFGGPDAKMFDRVGEDVRPIEKELQTIMKVEAVAIGIAFTDKGARIDIRAAYNSDAEAKEAETAVRAVAAYARKQLDEPKAKLKAMLEGKAGHSKPRPIRDLPEAVLGLFGTGALNMLDDQLANPPIKTEGNELVATFESDSLGGAYVGASAAGVALLLPAVQKVREAAGRMQGSNNLKQIGLAMHNYHDVYGRLPASDSKLTPNAKGAGLSWRVHLLPYIEQDALYREFKLDEPWDSAHNKPLIDRMPKTYASPLAIAPPGQTHYKAFVGNGALFESGRQIRITDITDGTSNTILAIEGGAPVIWTKPDDITFTGEIVPMTLALNGNPRINVGLADGSVRNIDLSRISPQTLKAAITRAGDDLLGPDWDGDWGGPGPLTKTKQDEAPKPFPKGKGGAPPKGGPPLIKP